MTVEWIADANDNRWISPLGATQDWSGAPVPVVPADFTALLEDAPGGQEIIIANGSYSIREMASATAGNTRSDWLILRAETQGGVHLIHEGAGTTIAQHRWLLTQCKKVCFVGIDFQNIVTAFDVDCHDLTFWYCTAAYPASEHPTNATASGSYTPSGFIVVNGGHARLRWLGCDVGPISDDAFRLKTGQDYELRGCKVGRLYNDAGVDPGYHEDSIQTLGGISGVANTYGLTISGCDFFGTVKATDYCRVLFFIENGFGDMTVLVEDTWLHTTLLNYAVNMGVRTSESPNSELTVTFDGFYIWDCGADATSDIVTEGAPNTTVIKTDYNELNPGGTSPADLWRSAQDQSYVDYKNYMGVAW